MVVPAGAFAECVPQDLAPGSIFKIPDAWALLISHEQAGVSVKSFIMQQRHGVGSLEARADMLIRF